MLLLTVCVQGRGLQKVDVCLEPIAPSYVSPDAGGGGRGGVVGSQPMSTDVQRTLEI
jgi:hypothetical protein